MLILVLPHKENKLHPSYRTIKSQDDFIEKNVRDCRKTRFFLWRD